MEFLIDTDDCVTLVEDEEISTNEVKTALESMKNWRIPGLDGLQIDRIKHDIEKLLELFVYVFYCFLRDGFIPPKEQNACLSNRYT